MTTLKKTSFFIKKVLNSAFEKEKLRVGGEGGVSIKKTRTRRTTGAKGIYF